MIGSYSYYKIFYYVARYKSFNRAAKVLLNSQPNISRAMNNLESELGCKLFVRSHQGVALTEEGELFFAYVQKAHHQLEEGIERLQNAKKAKSESVSLGITTGISDIMVRERILPVLRQFSKDNPTVNLRLKNDSTPQLIRQIEGGELDLAVITASEERNKSLQAQKLYEFVEIPVAGNSYRDLLKDRKVSIKKLADFPLITLSRETETFEFHDSIFANHGIILRPYIETCTLRQALTFIENDMGIGCLPEEYVRDSIREGKVFSVDVTEGIPPRFILLVKSAHSRAQAALDLGNQIVQFSEEEGPV